MPKDSDMQHRSTFSTSVVPPTSAWSLRAWPPLLWQAAEPAPAQIHHIGTRIAATTDMPGHPAGQTVWAAHAADGEVGMAWDWVQITHGVVAMADPMSLVTNLRLIGEEGEVLTAHQAACFLNGLVRALPWQLEVQRALKARIN